MKTLIIPDIHCKWQEANYIIKKYKDVDEVVCLGDYFDDFDDSPGLNKRTAKWLIDFISKKNHIALLGNHEFNYLYGKKIDICSGYSSSKNEIINRIMQEKHWKKLLPFYKTQGWYLTHAGITAPLIVHPIKGWNEDYFNGIIQEDMNKISSGGVGTLFRCGQMRGGYFAYGGITWCHFPEEFEPIEDIKQIFGHTPGDIPKQYKKTDNWCLDTNLNHIGIIENNKLRVLEV